MRFIPRIGVHSVQGDGFKWTEVLHPYGGQACPECGPVVIGANWRARHIAHHNELKTMHEQLVVLSRAVRELAEEAGHGDWYEPDEVPELRGRVIGNGPLPEEMRGGGE